MCYAFRFTFLNIHMAECHIKLKEKNVNLYFFVYYKHVLYVMSLIFINFARIYKTVITV